MKLLDLFCGAGGAAVGYTRAGFTVLGIDNRPQRHYPYDSVQADWLAGLERYAGTVDAIHASPPCQAYSITRHTHGRAHPDLVAPVRDALRATGLPYVIENVPGAPLIDPVTLCGTEFALSADDPASGRRLWLRRHRLFESSVTLMGAGGCHCAGRDIGGVYGAGSVDLEHARNVRHGGYTPPDKATRAELLGVDWPMTLTELSQAIPPAYTEHIGWQLADAVRMR